MYKLSINDGLITLYKDNIELKDTDIISITLERKVNNKVFKLKFKNTKSLITQLNELDYIKDISLYDSITLEKVDFTDLFKSTSHSLIIKTRYELETVYHVFDGVSDYRYLNYYMPKWSTAYKNYLSNHNKLIEPIASDIKYVYDFFKTLVNKDVTVAITDEKPLSTFTNTKYAETTVKSLTDIGDITYISKDIYNTLMSIKYIPFSKTLVDFGKTYNTIYLNIENYEVPLKLLIKGLSNDTFVYEEIDINSNSPYKLKLRYNKIYSIEVGIKNISLVDAESLIINISNYLALENLIYIDKNNDTSLIEENKKLIYKSGYHILNIFTNPFPNYSFMYIDENDNIVLQNNNSIYTSKLDSKINLNIPKNITYNNTDYIETTYLSGSTYMVEIFIHDFVDTLEDSNICIYIKDSKNKNLYLTKDLDLVDSDEHIFINISDISNRTIQLEISVDDFSEYALIVLEDYLGHYKKANLLTQPILRFNKSLDLKSNEYITMIDNKFKIVNEKDLTINNLDYKSLTYMSSDNVNYITYMYKDI